MKPKDHKIQISYFKNRKIYIQILNLQVKYRQFIFTNLFSKITQGLHFIDCQWIYEYKKVIYTSTNRREKNDFMSMT